MNVMLLAAGLGTRLAPLTNKYPKPSVPFLNVPLGFYQFQFLKHLPIDRLVVNTFHIAEKIHQLYKNQPYYKNEIYFSNESGKILGGAGGLKKASVFMKPDSPILLMNADEVYFTKQQDFLKAALKRHVENKNLSTVVVVEHPEAGKKFGALWAENLQVKDISKTAKHTNLIPWHCIGPIFLSWEALKLIPDYQETNIFYDTLLPQLSSGKVEIFPITADWYETGNPADYIEATKKVLSNLTPELLQFINQYDESDLIRNSQTESLVSKSKHIDSSKLFGVNVISKSADLLKMNKVKDSVLFDLEVVNADYFKT